MSLAINAPFSPRNLIATAVEWLQRGDRIAMLTLVAIEGSAPYPIGSQMLVNQQGEYRGQITGGCVETALAEQAVIAINSGLDATHRYGLGSPFFDIQLPCGSGIDVFIDVSTELAQFTEIRSALDVRRPVQQEMQQVLQSGQAAFTRTYYPNERLIIIGQGPIFASLAQLALLSGFEVICIAPDAGNIQRLTDLGIVANPIQTAVPDFTAYCDKFTALVSLFHEHDFETDVLRAALQTDLYYIGALGSQRTHAVRLQALRDQGIEGHSPDKIFGPVGIDLKAETPAQIAVSVLAQVIQKMPKQYADSR